MNANIPRPARSGASRSRLTGAAERAFAGGGLAILLTLWLLMAPLTSASTAANRPCLLGGGSAGCASTRVIARTSEDEAEVEGEGEEEAEAEATAEAEAEEGEGGGESPVNSSSSPSRAAARVPVISRLALTAKAAAALKHAKPLACAVEFSFVLSAPARVQVTLVKQTSAHGHKRWTVLPDSLTTNARKGHGSRKLTGHNRLSPGRYRLTVKPTSGRSRSIYLSAPR